MLLCGSSGAILSHWQGWGAAGVDGQEHLGALRWDKHPRQRGRVAAFAATATPGEQVSNAVMACVYTHFHPSIYYLSHSKTAAAAAAASLFRAAIGQK